MTLKTFSQFLVESTHAEQLIQNYAKKVAWVMQVSDVKSTSGGGITDREKKYNVATRKTLWNCYSTKEQYNDETVQIPLGMPILYYGGSDDLESELFLKSKAVDSRYLYNKRELLLLSGDKVQFGKLFANCSWLPKTVFTKEEALAGAVGFPVIAKIKNGHSGIGVEKFDSAAELQRSTEKFDLFCQFIDFKREYRIAFCRDKIFIVNERVPCIEDDLSIRTKKADEKISFIYVYQDVNRVDPEFLAAVQEICAQIKPKLDLDLWSLDVVVDGKGKIWVMETSSATGLGSVKMCEVYKAIYEDFYQEPLPDKFLEEIYQRFVVPGHQNYYPKYAKEIGQSQYAMDYKILTDPAANEGYRYFFNLSKPNKV